MAIPDWLTQDYVEQALRTHHKDAALRIVELEMKAALEPGENYSSMLTRMRVTYELSTKSSQVKNLILKSAIEDDELTQALMKPYNIYNDEMAIYENVLPKLNELLTDIDEYEQFYPTAVYVDRQRLAILFEDLTMSGYIMADRIKRLDMAHAQLILRKLAKMHAASATLNERNAGCLESYDRGLFNRYTNAYSGYFVGTLMAAARWLSQQPECSNYGQKLFELAPHYMEMGRSCFEPSSEHLNVLAHGDVWTNNVMFKYDAGQPIDVLLYDFQYSIWGSPALDLHQFFNTSLQEKLRREQQNTLIEFYHEIFTHTLNKFNYGTKAIPSLKEFQQQADQKRFYAMHCSIIVQPVMISEDATDACFNALMNDDERGISFKNRLFQNPRVQENLKALLPIFDKEGLLSVKNNV